MDQDQVDIIQALAKLVGAFRLLTVVFVGFIVIIALSGYRNAKERETLAQCHALMDAYQETIK